MAIQSLCSPSTWDVAATAHEEHSKDDLLIHVVSLDVDHSDSCHVWNVAMLLASCHLVTATINNFGAVVDCHNSQLGSCSGLLAVHGSQGKGADFACVDWGTVLFRGGVYFFHSNPKQEISSFLKLRSLVCPSLTPSEVFFSNLKV